MNWKRVLASGVVAGISGINKLRENAKSNSAMEKQEFTELDIMSDTDDEEFSEHAYWRLCDKEELIDLIEFERSRRNEFSYQWICLMASDIQLQIQELGEYEHFDEELQEIGIFIQSVASQITLDFSKLGREHSELHQVAWRALSSIEDIVATQFHPYEESDEFTRSSMAYNVANFYAWAYLVKRGLSERYVGDRLGFKESEEEHRKRIDEFLAPHLSGIFRSFDSSDNDSLRTLLNILSDQSPDPYMIEGSELFFRESATLQIRKAALSLSIYQGIIASISDTEESLWGPYLGAV